MKEIRVSSRNLGAKSPGDAGLEAAGLETEGPAAEAYLEERKKGKSVLVVKAEVYAVERGASEPVRDLAHAAGP